jgi:sulfate permease, SulP family
MHVGYLRRLITERLNPVRPWFSKVSHSSLRDDAMAGLTNAAIVLPQGVAFAIIAGLPPEYGLYTAMIPPIIAALYGSSMVMVSVPSLL